MQMCALPHQLLLKEYPGQKMCRAGAFEIHPFWKVMNCTPFIQLLLLARSLYNSTFIRLYIAVTQNPLIPVTGFLDAFSNNWYMWGTSVPQTSANNLVFLSVFQSKYPKPQTFSSALKWVGSCVPSFCTVFHPVYPAGSLRLEPLPSIICSEIQISLMATV